jgi:type II secretory pathway predicted ATPase ExeA
MSSGYESFFGLDERPFSLTPDPKYFFKSRSHGRVIETLTVALNSREPLLLVTGDLGVGKTLLCRTLVDQIRSRGLASFVASPLVTPAALMRLLLEDFGAMPAEEIRRDLTAATAHELIELLTRFLAGHDGRHQGVVVIVDEAQTMPAAVVEQLQSLASLESNGERLLQLVLVGQPVRGELHALGIRVLDELVSTKARLLPLGREECAAYVAHRLTIAGGAATVSFTPRAIDLVYALSGGVPRLVNLLCERALQEAAAAGAHDVEPGAVDAAASALELLRARPRRFRWFAKRVS